MLLAADLVAGAQRVRPRAGLTGVAIVFGASAWLLLMAALIVFLQPRLRLAVAGCRC